jgi:hypothetical protein
MTEDLTGVTWRVSSRSNSGGGNCVEVGALVDGSGRVAVRDSKDRPGPVLLFPRTDWRAFLAAVPEVSA